MSEMDKDILLDKKEINNKIKTNQHKPNNIKKKNNQNKPSKSNKKNNNTKYSNNKTNQHKSNNKNNSKKNNFESKNTKKEIKKTSEPVNKNEKHSKKQPEQNKKIILENKNNIPKTTNKSINKSMFLFIVFAILLLSLLVITYKMNYDKQLQNHQEKIKDEIATHFNQFVITNKDATIYKLDNKKYIEAGTISNNQELILHSEEINYQNEYFKITSFNEEYYIHYKDVDVIKELSTLDTRYKNYIIFNENIITKDKTNFYDESGSLVYTFNSSFEFSIIIKKKEEYGIEFNNRLLYIKSEDILEIKDSNNTNLTNTSGIAALNYHFFYDETKAEERKDCNQIICHSKSGFTKHLEYIKNNNIFTPTMNEFEMYLNQEINLPKSVLITIDDGWRAEIAKELLEKYKLNGTIFLITSWFEEINFLNNLEYVEYHSHGDNIHNQGECPGGQGGAIKCKDKTELLKDLSLSRKKLNGSTAFCYPFYEYNSYSISILKEAGFTLAFANGYKRANPSTDKYQIPRYVMYDSTTVNQLKSYIG